MPLCSLSCFYCYAKCCVISHNAKCHYAEGRVFLVMLCIVVLNVTMPSVIMLSVTILIVILSVVVLHVTMPSVIMLSVTFLLLC
jgi:hypothetical protein